MPKKLYVGGLSWDTNDSKLLAAFETHGEVSEAKVITDRDSGRSRGFGFVTYADSSSAEQAISKMDGSILDGRTLKVNEAQDRRRDDRGPRR